jgi:hypothetical protein
MYNPVWLHRFLQKRHAMLASTVADTRPPMRVHASIATMDSTAVLMKLEQTIGERKCGEPMSVGDRTCS